MENFGHNLNKSPPYLTFNKKWKCLVTSWRSHPHSTWDRTYLLLVTKYTISLFNLWPKVDMFDYNLDKSPNQSIFNYIQTQTLNLIITRNNAPFFNENGSWNSTCVLIVLKDRMPISSMSLCTMTVSFSPNIVLTMLSQTFFSQCIMSNVCLTNKCYHMPMHTIKSQPFHQKSNVGLENLIIQSTLTIKMLFVEGWCEN